VQGHANAQYGLGMAYTFGQGVPQDDMEAAKWYRLAAVQGHAYAQNNLGMIYFKGSGVPVNRVVAYALFNLSAANDPSADNSATRNRNSLVENISRSELEAGQALTREMIKPKNLLVALDRYVKR